LGHDFALAIYWDRRCIWWRTKDLVTENAFTWDRDS